MGQRTRPPLITFVGRLAGCRWPRWRGLEPRSDPVGDAQIGVRDLAWFVA